jgi:hypothetical protein
VYQTNVLKLEPGMSAADVVNILGNKYSEVRQKGDKDGSYTRVWGESIRITIAIRRIDLDQAIKAGTAAVGKSKASNPPFGKVW